MSIKMIKETIIKAWMLKTGRLALNAKNMRVFKDDTRVKSVVISGDVKTVPKRAFSGCKNLTDVVICNGVKELGEDAFSFSSKLKSVVIPDSVNAVNYTVFYACNGIEKPILNTSGTTLFYYSVNSHEREYRIPESVTHICTMAFGKQSNYLKRVILPNGLKTIDSRAFYISNIQEIVIPASVQLIKSRAFEYCPELKSVEIHGANTIIEDAAFNDCPKLNDIKMAAEIDICRLVKMLGRTFLEPGRCSEPAGEYCEDEAFLELARRCAQYDVDAMTGLGNYFLAMRAADAEDIFFEYAANFWYYQAYMRGNNIAAKYINEWIKIHPCERMKAVLPESLNFAANGRVLNKLGFMFFEPDEYYRVSMDKDRVAEAEVYDGCDGRDEDGYGMEENYKWNVLNDMLSPVPGASDTLSGTEHEKKYCNLSRQFEKAHDIVKRSYENKPKIVRGV